MSSSIDGAKRVFLVLSGKGGVGKSSVTVQLASAFSAAGKKAGILDVDLCAPSIARMTGVEGQDVCVSPSGKWVPVKASENLTILSLALFLNSKNDAVVWRGPKKNAMIKQMLTNIEWDVDVLLIDTPPGTSDEHITVMENLKGRGNIQGAILVTTPQMVSVDDVIKELTFCRKTGINVIGVIENMSGFVCPHCSECSNILACGGGEEMAKKWEIPFLGRIPIDPKLGASMDTGVNFFRQHSSSEAASVFKNIALAIGT